MGDRFGGEAQLRKAEFLAEVTNKVLQELVIRCAKTEVIRDYFQVAVVGYGVGKNGVASALGGALQGRDFVKISELAENPVRVDTRTKKIPDGAGGLVDTNVRFPVWVDPRNENGTPMCSAIRYAQKLVTEWLSEHGSCFPPIVLHITDGESGDGDPRPLAKELTSLSSTDGGVLFFNCHVSSSKAPKVIFPSDDSGLPDEPSRVLYESSSVVPSAFSAAAKEHGINLSETTRGFVFNADPVDLVQFFEIGTRPSNLR